MNSCSVIRPLWYSTVLVAIMMAATAIAPPAGSASHPAGGLAQPLAERRRPCGLGRRLDLAGGHDPRAPRAVESPHLPPAVRRGGAPALQLRHDVAPVLVPQEPPDAGGPVRAEHLRDASVDPQPSSQVRHCPRVPAHSIRARVGPSSASHWRSRTTASAWLMPRAAADAITGSTASVRPARIGIGCVIMSASFRRAASPQTAVPATASRPVSVSATAVPNAPMPTPAPSFSPSAASATEAVAARGDPAGLPGRLAGFVGAAVVARA